MDTLVCLFFEFFLLFGKVRDNFHLRDHFFDAFLQLFTVWSLEGRDQETRLIQLENMLWISNLLMDARCDPLQISAKVLLTGFKRNFALKPMNLGCVRINLGAHFF